MDIVRKEESRSQDATARDAQSKIDGVVCCTCQQTSMNWKAFARLEDPLQEIRACIETLPEGFELADCEPLVRMALPRRRWWW